MKGKSEDIFPLYTGVAPPIYIPTTVEPPKADIL